MHHYDMMTHEEERLKDIHDKIARDLLKELKEMGYVVIIMQE